MQVFQIAFRDVLPKVFLCIASLLVSGPSESDVYGCLCFVCQARDCCESNWQLQVEVHEVLMRGCSFSNDFSCGCYTASKNWFINTMEQFVTRDKKGICNFYRLARMCQFCSDDHVSKQRSPSRLPNWLTIKIQQLKFSIYNFSFNIGWENLDFEAAHLLSCICMFKSAIWIQFSK